MRANSLTQPLGVSDDGRARERGIRDLEFKVAIEGAFAEAGRVRTAAAVLNSLGVPAQARVGTFEWLHCDCCPAGAELLLEQHPWSTSVVRMLRCMSSAMRSSKQQLQVPGERLAGRERHGHDFGPATGACREGYSGHRCEPQGGVRLEDLLAGAVVQRGPTRQRQLVFGAGRAGQVLEVLGTQEQQLGRDTAALCGQSLAEHGRGALAGQRTAQDGQLPVGTLGSFGG